MMGIWEITAFLLAKWALAFIIFTIFIERFHPQSHNRLLSHTFLKIHGAIMAIVGVVTLMTGLWLLSLNLPYNYRHDVHLAPILLAIPTLLQIIAPSLSAWLTLRSVASPADSNASATP